MRKFTFIFHRCLLAVLCIALSAGLITGTVQAEEYEPGTIVILATGGTIAGSGETGKETGYTSGAIRVEDLVASVPMLKDVAPLEAIQVCNINSDDITGEIWVKLATTINEMAKNENIRGFVITHGTDTLEETAYFLNLTLKTDKPVVLTGSMRPATSMSPDGPMNLYQAVCTANAEESVGKGVLAVFSDCIISARSCTKTSTYHLDAVSADETGVIGIVRDDRVYYYDTPAKKHTTQSEFSVDENSVLPKVSVLYFSADADPELLSYAAAHSDGLVIAGAGAGEFSKQYIDIINSLDIPVVITSRIGEGIITESGLLCPGHSIAGDNLPPQKAAVLLRLAILSGADYEAMRRIFSEY